MNKLNILIIKNQLAIINQLIKENGLNLSLFYNYISFFNYIIFSYPYYFHTFKVEDGLPPNDKDLILSKIEVLKENNVYFDLIKLSVIKILHSYWQFKQYCKLF